jgi:predicted ArsR family transcriptional regulator
MSRVRHDKLVRLCVLDDPARWSAYLAVRRAHGPVTRADVAEEVGISAKLAAFHLEKLVAEGFLEATYERDDSPAAVGHPAKRYRPTGLELEVSIPPRRYDLAAEILVEAIDPQATDPAPGKLADVAIEFGREVGRQAGAANGDDGMLNALRVVGYEPAAVDGEVVLRNCPFLRIAQARPDIVCAMNVAFVAGLLDGTRTTAFSAVLSPSSERCCVLVAPTHAPD